MQPVKSPFGICVCLKIKNLKNLSHGCHVEGLSCVVFFNYGKHTEELQSITCHIRPQWYLSSSTGECALP